MRVLMISHGCQSKTEGQPKAECIAQLEDIELMVLAPDRWNHFGTWRSAQPPETTKYTYIAGEVRWPWVGPAQFYLHFYPGLSKLLREFRPDIIDLWEEPWSMVSAQAVYLRSRLLPKTRIVSETEQNINKRLPPPFEQMRQFTLRNADYAVARNSEAVKVLNAKGYHGPTAIVPNAVDPHLFRPLDRDACRSQFGLDGFVVGYVGRIVELKGLTDLVDALSFCPEDVNLLIVGSGEFEPQLRTQVQQTKNESRVRFLPAQPMEALPQIMNAIDVLALPSRTTPRGKEQFGRVLIEAHACATPVIGSSSGAIAEVTGKGGVIVPERAPEALADAIISLRADPAWRRELGLIGRAQVKECYTWERVAEQMADIYRELMKQ